MGVPPPQCEQTTLSRQYSKESETLGLVSASFDIQRGPVSCVRLREAQIQGENNAQGQAGDGLRFLVISPLPRVNREESQDPRENLHRV